MATHSVCPSCYFEVPARVRKCPGCGRVMHVKNSNPSSLSLWFWILAGSALATIILSFAYYGVDPGPPGITGPLRAGDHAVAHLNAWVARDDDAWNLMLDAQNNHSPDLIKYLSSKERIFLVGKGSRVLVIKVAMGSLFVQAEDGAEGWVQTELFVRAH